MVIVVNSFALGRAAPPLFWKTVGYNLRRIQKGRQEERAANTILLTVDRSQFSFSLYLLLCRVVARRNDASGHKLHSAVMTCPLGVVHSAYDLLPRLGVCRWAGGRLLPEGSSCSASLRL